MEERPGRVVVKGCVDGDRDSGGQEERRAESEEGEWPWTVSLKFPAGEADPYFREK